MVLGVVGRIGELVNVCGVQWLDLVREHPVVEPRHGASLGRRCGAFDADDVRRGMAEHTEVVAARVVEAVKVSVHGATVRPSFGGRKMVLGVSTPCQHGGRERRRQVASKPDHPSREPARGPLAPTPHSVAVGFVSEDYGAEGRGGDVANDASANSAPSSVESARPAACIASKSLSPSTPRRRADVSACSL